MQFGERILSLGPLALLLELFVQLLVVARLWAFDFIGGELQDCNMLNVSFFSFCTVIFLTFLAKHRRGEEIV